MEDEKVSVILDAARKRFGHFGAAKTTMNEIAADIGMSKASLYYYFPDKEHLFVAVVEQDFDAFLNAVQAIIKKPNRASYKLKKFVRMRNKFLGELLGLAKVESISASEAMKPAYDSLRQRLLARERAVVASILTMGVSEKEFIKLDADNYADLFLSILSGLRTQSLGFTAVTDIPAFQQRLNEQSELFLDIFLRGIMKS